jgi:hypothetical protein
MKRKKISYFFIIALVICTINSNAQTTLEEYNYLTKGYKVQMESGLDMKKGYELSSVDAENTSQRNAELKLLHRLKNSKKEIAAYLIIYNKIGNEKEYICVPNPKSNDDVKSLYWKMLYDGTTDSSQRLQLICYLLTNQLKW